MKAMVLQEYNKDLVYKDVPDPVAGHGEIVLKVKACGMCFTDVKITTGVLDKFVTLPHIPGHEIAGEVAAVGQGVTGIKVGDKGVAYFILSCGRCEFCLDGLNNLCTTIRRLGFEADGGYGEYVRMPAANFCGFTAEKSFETMAVIPDAVATSYHAVVNMANLKVDKRLLIMGAGGLGLNALQIAVHMGLRVTVAARNPAAIELAKELGAESIINFNEVDPLEAGREITGGVGFDAVLEGVGYASTMAWTLKSLKKGGTCVIMGYDPVNPIPIELINIHNNEWRIVGTKVSTLNGLKKSVELVERGIVIPQIEKTIGITNVNQALADLKKGGLLGRIVISYT